MKILALDLGVTSCAYSIVKQVKDNSYSLIDYGVVMRDIHMKNGTQKDRREFASARKLTKKRKQRVKKIKAIFQSFGLSFKENRDYNIWKLRAQRCF